jgi:MOSC domain-containing protein YiiM
LYAWLRERGVNVGNGAVGENFTTRGLDLLALRPGDKLRVGGECVIQITDVRVPCRQLRKWDAALPTLIVGRSGWMARVLESGEVKAGDPVEVLP